MINYLGIVLGYLYDIFIFNNTEAINLSSIIGAMLICSTAILLF